ncbi:MAG: type II secretion system protein [Gammaproteobacteria bacterium]|nr:type II secretion system protein [Gammaproteobacteria bacterium]MCW5582639.1 type II secretion system protein [Gammaproteobacteria bacterium]
MAMRSKFKGFTLIEMLLVLVIISLIIYASIGYIQQRTLRMQYDRTSTQMQQILNAGLSFYIFNGRWPDNLDELSGIPSGPVYIPSGLRNPWGNNYEIASTAQILYVYSRINFVTARGAYAATNVIAGMLPLAYTSNDVGGSPPNAGSPCTVTDTRCSIVSGVNIPGYNLSNAPAVNFAGIYHHGGCVPVPECPVDPRTGNTMTPQIMVAPVQVAGTSDGGAPTTTPTVYPISSFGAYATGPGGVSAQPAQCSSGGTLTCAIDADKRYWRVCISVVTGKGEITSTAPGWGENQTLLAITRCSIANEPAGSPFNVYSD